MKKALSPLLLLIFVLTSYAQQELNGSDFSDPKDKFISLKAASDDYYNQGNYRKSREINLELLKTALQIDEPYHMYVGYRFLAYDYLALNDTIMARENFLKSVTLAEKAKTDSITAMSYMDLGNFYSTIEYDYKKSMRYHNDAIKLLNKIGDSVNLAKAHYNTVLTAFENEKFNIGYGHLIHARKLRHYLKHSGYDAGLENLMGEYYFYRENYPLSQSYLKKAISIAEKDSLYIELENAYEFLSDGLFAMGKTEEAYAMREEFEKYSFKNIQNEVNAGYDDLSAKFQVEEYRKDVQAAEIENQLQKEIVASKSKLNIILLVVSVCILTLLVILFFAFRKRKDLVAQLQRKNKEYLNAKEETEKLSKAKSKFFSTVSHELRTPLYGVIGLSTLLLEDESLKKHESDLKSLKFSADYLLALINDVLHINKIDSKSIEDEKAYFNIRELIKTIVSSFEYMRLQNSNTFHVRIDEEIPKLVRGNSMRISQILMNLIGNACKFTEYGNIHVVAELADISSNKAGVQFSIRDTGIGIAKEKLATIFDEFSQGDSINYNYQGTGLGLPIVKKLLSLSNSEIQVESELGKGSDFSFKLEFDILNKAYKKEQAPILDTHVLKNKRVLIVEDNRINQTVTKKILEREGIFCELAENGQVAISKAKGNVYDLILMDINMPVMNGLDASVAIRAFDPKTPILALTAVEVEEMRQSIYDSGMNDIIVKPYDISKFTQTIIRHVIGVNEDGKMQALRAM